MMSTRESSPIHSTNSNSRRQGSTSTQHGSGDTAGVQRSENGSPLPERKRNKFLKWLFPKFSSSKSPSEHTGQRNIADATYPNGRTIAGRTFIVVHLILLIIYCCLGFLSWDKENFLEISVYIIAIITSFIDIALYSADFKKSSSRKFGKKEENLLRYRKKAIGKGIIVPLVNIILLVVQYKKVGQDIKTFVFGIAAFALHIVGNVLLIWGMERRQKPEEHELGDNPTGNNLPTDHSISAS